MLLRISDNMSALKKKFWDDRTERSKGVLEGIVAANLGFGVCGIALLSWVVAKGYVRPDAQVGLDAKSRPAGGGIPWSTETSACVQTVRLSCLRGEDRSPANGSRLVPHILTAGEVLTLFLG